MYARLYKAPTPELSVLLCSIASVIEKARSITLSQFPAPPPTFRGLMATGNRVPNRRNPRVFNSISNDVSSTVFHTPLPLDNLPERIPVRNPRKRPTSHAFLSDRYTLVVPVSNARSRTHSPRKDADPRNHTTRFRLLPTSGTVRSNSRAAVTLID